jgi:hypothetical protein
MVVQCVLLSFAFADEPEPPASRAKPEAAPPAAVSARRTRIGLTVGRAITGKVVDNDAFADAELHGSNFLTLSAVFGCEMGCIGFVLPIEGVRATSTGVTTGGTTETELKTTTLAPSLRLAYTYTPPADSGFGATGTFDVGYTFSVGGNVDVRGLSLGIAGDLEYWLPSGVALALGVGLSGSPFSVLHYPTVRLGAEYAF